MKFDRILARQLEQNGSYQIQLEELAAQEIEKQSVLLSRITKNAPYQNPEVISQVILISFHEDEYPDLIERLHQASRNLMVLVISPDHKSFFIDQNTRTRSRAMKYAAETVIASLSDALPRPIAMDNDPLPLSQPNL